MAQNVSTTTKEYRNIVLSGGAQGIGRCIARSFLQAGHRVFLIDINEEELKYTCNTHLKHYTESDRLTYSVCNLRDVDAIRSTIDQAAKYFNNKIDVLINNGGIATPQWKDGKTFENPDTMQEWVAFLETNLTAPFAVSQACIPYMKRATEKAAEDEMVAGPSIIHVGSFRAHQSDPNQEGYAASKAGLLGLMVSQSISCEPWGIRVNLIAPGRIKATHESREGDEQGKSFQTEHEDKDIEQHPTNRAGTPEDIAQAVEYLINAGFVTGQELTVDGGVLKKKNK